MALSPFWYVGELSGTLEGQEKGIAVPGGDQKSLARQVPLPRVHGARSVSKSNGLSAAPCRCAVMGYECEGRELE